MISIIFLVLYFLLLIIHIGGEWFKNVKIRLITKPFLMPLLILYYVFNLNLGILNWFFIVGLIFAWFGDIFLMVEKEGKWFIYGLGSFLICQIFFIISFALSIANILSFPFWGFFLILFEIFIMSFILFRIQGKMGDLKIPTYVYVAAIFTMGLFAVLRLDSFNFISLSFLFPWIGSLLFIISDGIIAVDKFDKHIPHDRFYVMLTYGVAQFLITQGIIFTQIFGI